MVRVEQGLNGGGHARGRGTPRNGETHHVRHWFRGALSRDGKGKHAGSPIPTQRESQEDLPASPAGRHRRELVVAAEGTVPAEPIVVTSLNNHADSAEGKAHTITTLPHRGTRLLASLRDGSLRHGRSAEDRTQQLPELEQPAETDYPAITAIRDNLKVNRGGRILIVNPDVVTTALDVIEASETPLSLGVICDRVTIVLHSVPSVDFFTLPGTIASLRVATEGDDVPPPSQVLYYRGETGPIELDPAKSVS